MAGPEVVEPLDTYDIEVETLIIGAGACGMIAALAAHEAGQDALVIEADTIPSGSTAVERWFDPGGGYTVSARGWHRGRPGIVCCGYSSESAWRKRPRSRNRVGVARLRGH